MTKKASMNNGNSLVIVESPAKAKTISKYLGKNFDVEASVGHIRDLAVKKEMPADLKREDWAYLGVNVHQGFEPVYIISDDKKEQIRKLRKLVREAKDIYLATDEDREGEAISWHLLEVLKPKIPVHRMVFHEITKTAIENALANPREIDDDLVRAQETRRILDRLYGFDVSGLLQRRTHGVATSAGRVQSVAVRKVVERERKRIAFRSATYWDLLGLFAKQQPNAKGFEATLVQLDGQRLSTGKDFDPNTGLLKDSKVLQLTEAQVEDLRQKLSHGEFKVATLEDKPYTSKPSPPFETSALVSEANRRFRFSAKRTMQVAQNLYQNGFITYMRTDSTALSSEAITAARQHIQSEYGNEYLPEKPREYKNKVKNAQEAHEAIRPTGSTFRSPAEVKGELGQDAFQLYELIWKCTVASEMKDAQGRRITISIEGVDSDGRTAKFHVSGKTIDFPGYLRAYVEGSDDPDSELASQESILPDVAVGEVIDCRQLDAKSHTTQPPARYTEASLTRTLKDDGIGRPSTYASIIDVILQREYVFKRGTALVPTWKAMVLIKTLESHFSHLVDYQFTARMEDDLDAISRGDAGHLDYLEKFYFGGEHQGLKEQVEKKLEEIDVREICRFTIGKPESSEGDAEEIILKVFKNNSTVAQGELSAVLPFELAPDELTIEKAVELLENARRSAEPLGVDPDTGGLVFFKQGPHGPYVQLNSRDENDEEPVKKRQSLLKGMEPEDVDLKLALQLLTLPRTLGEHPESKKPIEARDGRFGPYVVCEKESRSLPAEVSPLDVTLEKALELLAQPKQRGRRNAAPKEPLKSYEEKSPVTEEAVKILDGRFGPYITDGTTNASLPRGMTIEEVTFDAALEMLAERAAKGPSKKKKPKKKAKKKAAKKKSTPKKKKAAKAKQKS